VGNNVQELGRSVIVQASLQSDISNRYHTHLVFLSGVHIFRLANESLRRKYIHE